MRKMLPNGTGTILPATWAVGDSVVLDEQWAINVPTNIPTVFMPYWPMLRAVAFVQNDATKEIMQGGRSSAAAVVPLAAITNLTSIFTCTSSIKLKTNLSLRTSFLALVANTASSSANSSNCKSFASVLSVLKINT